MSDRIADNILEPHNQRGERIMLAEEFNRILTEVVRTVHDQTAERTLNLDRAIHTVIRGAKVLSAINRALTMAVCFIESDGQSTMGAPRSMAR